MLAIRSCGNQTFQIQWSIKPLRRAKRYQEAALESIYQFKGFEDDAPMSAEDLKRELFYGNWEVQ